MTSSSPTPMGPPPVPPRGAPRHDAASTPDTQPGRAAGGPAAPRTGGGAGPAASPPPTRTAHGLTITVAATLLAFVTVVLVLFVMFNTQTVDVSLVFGNVDAPLVLALAVAAILGGLVVALAGLAARGRRKHRRGALSGMTAHRSS